MESWKLGHQKHREMAVKLNQATATGSDPNLPLPSQIGALTFSFSRTPRRSTAARRLASAHPPFSP